MQDLAVAVCKGRERESSSGRVSLRVNENREGVSENKSMNQGNKMLFCDCFIAVMF